MPNNMLHGEQNIWPLPLMWPIVLHLNSLIGVQAWNKWSRWILDGEQGVVMNAVIVESGIKHVM